MVPTSETPDSERVRQLVRPRESVITLSDFLPSFTCCEYSL